MRSVRWTSLLDRDRVIVRCNVLPYGKKRAFECRHLKYRRMDFRDVRNMSEISLFFSSISPLTNYKSKMIFPRFLVSERSLLLDDANEISRYNCSSPYFYRYKRKKFIKFYFNRIFIFVKIYFILN